MIVCLRTEPSSLAARVHDIVRLYYPGWRITSEEPPGGADVVVNIIEDRNAQSLRLRAEVCNGGRAIAAEEYFTLHGSENEKEGEARRVTRLIIYRVLAGDRGMKVNPYGILTGVRPTKLVHRWLDQGMSTGEIQAKLQEDYDLYPEKAALLTTIATGNRKYLLEPSSASSLISVYIGIPYCPSRCSYCSFPGAVLEEYSRQIQPFLEALEAEVEALGRMLREQNLKVQCIYIGGGTPTVLAEEDITRLFTWLHRYYITDTTVEITVEAGRPDTLTPGKLKTLIGLGANRISINPQTMNDSTLRFIGRNHSVEEVVRSVEYARQAGFKKINMDLIIGLPREGIAENTNTAERILELRPENVTVHTLALKKGSLLAETESKSQLWERSKEVEEGVELFRRLLTGNGYIPYYLYRQKYMLANLENLGYALPEQFCLYNIQVIEERQTILGLGGGAASKFVHPRGWTVKSFYNPKDPVSYVRSVPRLISNKVDNLQALT